MKQKRGGHRGATIHRSALPQLGDVPVGNRCLAFCKISGWVARSLGGSVDHQQTGRLAKRWYGYYDSETCLPSLGRASPGGRAVLIQLDRFPSHISVGSAFLLSDSYGLSFPLLLSLRYAFRTHRVVRRILVLSGLLLTIALALFPMDPGPMLLGDLVPMLNVFSLTLWYLYQALRGIGGEGRKAADVLENSTGLYMERKTSAMSLFNHGCCNHHLLHHNWCCCRRAEIAGTRLPPQEY